MARILWLPSYLFYLNSRNVEAQIRYALISEAKLISKTTNGFESTLLNNKIIDNILKKQKFIPVFFITEMMFVL
jgi:hypothetical protein